MSLTELTEMFEPCSVLGRLRWDERGVHVKARDGEKYMDLRHNEKVILYRG